MNIGLTKEEINSIQNVFKFHQNIFELKLFGSRAIGNYKPFSDIDLAIIGNNLNLQQLNKIETSLDELIYLMFLI